MRVDVGDIELHVHEKGAGRPFLAVHGGPGVDGSVWFPALDPLADEGWRVLAVDQRANGLSDSGDPARWTVALMRSVSLGTSVRPSVATEIVCRARLMVTASSAGFSARASTTERAKHFSGSVIGHRGQGSSSSLAELSPA